jgi:hypothetical protein
MKIRLNHCSHTLSPSIAHLLFGVSVIFALYHNTINRWHTPSSRYSLIEKRRENIQEMTKMKGSKLIQPLIQYYKL